MIPEDQANSAQLSYQAGIRCSPILFTAPHSKNLKRGKPQQKIQDHARQSFTSYLAVDLAISSNSSFMIWKATKETSLTDLDPNYLLEQQFAISPFHQSLHYWASVSPSTPLLHLDLHGKKNRSNNCHIDIGIRSMQVHWKKDPLAKQIKHFFQNRNSIFDGYQFGDFKCQFDTSPIFQGYWGGDNHTMSQQAILLGIPSIQMELPYDVRKKMFEDNILRERFRLLILELYESVIVPDYKRREGQYKVSKQLGNKLKANVSQEGYQQLKGEIITFQLGMQLL